MPHSIEGGPTKLARVPRKLQHLNTAMAILNWPLPGRDWQKKRKPKGVPTTSNSPHAGRQR
jgi:hypothetical protein